MSLPQVLHFGPLNIHYYGLIMGIAVAAGYGLAGRRAKRFGFNAKLLESLFAWLVVGGFIGARGYHVLSEWEFYLSSPQQILQVWHGGLSIFGALFGGATALFIYFRFKRLNGYWWKLLDWLAPCLLLGQIVGRFGNLFNYEALGGPSNLPWAIFVPPQFRILSYENFEYFHPFPIYEQIGNLALFIFIWWLEKFHPGKFSAGGVFFIYLVGYNILRFGLEWLRLDHRLVFEFLPFNALMALFLAGVGLFGIMQKRKAGA